MKALDTASTADRSYGSHTVNGNVFRLGQSRLAINRGYTHRGPVSLLILSLDLTQT